MILRLVARQEEAVAMPVAVGADDLLTTVSVQRNLG